MAEIRRAVAAVRAELLRSIVHPAVRDVVLIGSASDRYVWVPSRLVDFDAFVFVEARTSEVGQLLLGVRDRLTDRLARSGIDFEMRIIRGAYKPDRSPGDPPIVLAHVGVFTEESYVREESAVKRWGWRKYEGAVDPQRLTRLAPTRPTADDLLHGPRGVLEKLQDLQRGATTMEEWLLPDFELVRRLYRQGEPAFVEFCHGAVATSARHHARLLCRPEADTLGNDEFFVWYHENVLATGGLLPVVELKRRSRDEGFGGIGERSREGAIRFLQELVPALQELVRGERAGAESPGPGR